MRDREDIRREAREAYWILLDLFRYDDKPPSQERFDELRQWFFNLYYPGTNGSDDPEWCKEPWRTWMEHWFKVRDEFWSKHGDE